MSDVIDGLQSKVNAALLGGDWQTLSEMIAPDARIIGPRGYVIDRDTWIGVHRESGYRQVRLDVTESDARQYGDAGLRFDLVESECLYQGETITGAFRVTQVWVTQRERWQLVAVQYTTAAD